MIGACTLVNRCIPDEATVIGIRVGLLPTETVMSTRMKFKMPNAQNKIITTYYYKWNL